jgi:hypothetical protein
MSALAESPAPVLRRGLLWLAALTSLGLAVELGVERHWTQPIQLVAWVAVAAILVAAALMGRAPTRRRVRLAQILAVVVVLSAALGIWEHVYSNYDAGELDRRYASTWASLSEPTRWWLAVSKSVGPSPPLAPGALAQAGLCVLLAAVRHPALRTDRFAHAPAEETGARELIADGRPSSR